MKKKDAMKWVNALRSGKYKQTKEVLFDGYENYCCLGVLCDINPKLDLRGYTEDELLGGFKTIGLTTDDGFLCKINGKSISLSLLNDYGIPETGPLTFDEIADIIQIEYIEGL